jgi:glucan biosynthesis protein C
MVPPRRYPAFDALRAIAMELGLVLHAAVPYTQGCPASWVACDLSRSAAFDLSNTVIHAFRMPVFFLMSGFFAALLLERVGTGAFVRHRLRRIGLPLLVACLLLVPLIRAIWILGAFKRPEDALVGNFPASLMAHFGERGLRIFETIWHLWFLEYLLLLTAVYLGLRHALARLPLQGALDRLADRLVSPTRALWLALPTALAMGAMKGWNVDGIGELVPVPHMLAYYGIFFAAGVLLYRRRDDLAALAPAWRLHLALGLAVLVPGLVLLARLQARAGAGAPWIDAAGRVLSGLLTCVLLFGLVGFFVARFDSESRRQRYLADAAYFVYLAHFPLIALLGLGMAQLPGPALLKFGAVLGIAAPILLTIYHLAVRHGAIGRVLHGPR